jgi:hypothetical protein
VPNYLAFSEDLILGVARLRTNRSWRHAAYLTNHPECRGMLLSEAQEWLQEARHRGSTLPLLADLILDVTSGEAEKLSSR